MCLKVGDSLIDYTLVGISPPELAFDRTAERGELDGALGEAGSLSSLKEGSSGGFVSFC